MASSTRRPAYVNQDGSHWKELVCLQGLLHARYHRQVLILFVATWKPLVSVEEADISSAKKTENMGKICCVSEITGILNPFQDLGIYLMNRMSRIFVLDCSLLMIAYYINPTVPAVP